MKRNANNAPRFPSMLLALRAIANMHVGPDTDHAQLSALCIAIAKIEVEKAGEGTP